MITPHTHTHTEHSSAAVIIRKGQIYPHKIFTRPCTIWRPNPLISLTSPPTELSFFHPILVDSLFLPWGLCTCSSLPGHAVLTDNHMAGFLISFQDLSLTFSVWPTLDALFETVASTSLAAYNPFICLQCILCHLIIL